MIAAVTARPATTARASPRREERRRDDRGDGDVEPEQARDRGSQDDPDRAATPATSAGGQAVPGEKRATSATDSVSVERIASSCSPVKDGCGCR